MRLNSMQMSETKQTKASLPDLSGSSDRTTSSANASMSKSDSNNAESTKSPESATSASKWAKLPSRLLTLILGFSPSISDAIASQTATKSWKLDSSQQELLLRSRYAIDFE